METNYSDDTFWQYSYGLQHEGRDCLSTFCVFRLGWKITSISISISKLGQIGYIKLTFPSSSITETEQWIHVYQFLLCRSKYRDLITTQHLFDVGTEVMSSDKDRSIPLHQAVMVGNDTVAWLLINRGADVSAVNSSG